MAELKTKPTGDNLNHFINSVEPEWKRDDSKVLLEMLERISGQKPQMWGASIIGYGSYHYKYESGREGDWFLTDFSPRKQNMTVYLVGGFEGVEHLLEKLGKHKVSVGCLYFKRLADIDTSILDQLVRHSITTLKERYKEFN
ncbi:MAG: DUF1801 domain-containing protein [Ekhidna sp.]